MKQEEKRPCITKIFGETLLVENFLASLGLKQTQGTAFTWIIIIESSRCKEKNRSWLCWEELVNMEHVVVWSVLEPTEIRNWYSG